MPETERTNLYLPAPWKRKLRDLGEPLGEFVREAMRREFRRRKIEVERMDDIKPGRPRVNEED